jgi:hypothetical protein
MPEDETLWYLQLTTVAWPPSPQGPRGRAYTYITSHEVLFSRWVIINEPDEYTPPDWVPNQDPTLSNGYNRRTRVMPMAGLGTP